MSMETARGTKEDNKTLLECIQNKRKKKMLLDASYRTLLCTTEKDTQKCTHTVELF